MIAADKTLKIYGPPGCGKTHELLKVMSRELKNGIKPERIAYVTFTRVAKREAVERVMEEFGFGEERLPNFKTLHALAYRVLGVTGQTMLKGHKDYAPLGELLNLKFSSKYRDDNDGDGVFRGEEGDKLLAFDNFRRANLWTVQEAYRRWPEDIPLPVVERFSETYTRWKTKHDRLDFTDLLEQVDQPLPIDIAIVDEAQDLSRLQWAVLDKFIANAKRLYVAGDDDQAIFTWAGASPTAFIERPGRFRVLGQSYRCPPAVHALAQQIAKRITHRQEKTWQPKVGAPGKVTTLLTPEHLDISKYEGSWRVLYRNNSFASDVEAQLRSDGQPYMKQDQPASGMEFAPAIVWWERLRRGLAVDKRVALQVYEAMTVGRQLTRTAKTALQKRESREQVTLTELKEHYGLLTEDPWFTAFNKVSDEQIYYLRQVIRYHGSQALLAEPRIKLSTIHSAKGAQADNVALLTQVSPRTRETMERDPDSERRVFYVGVTRAKQTLTLVGVDNPIF